MVIILQICFGTRAEYLSDIQPHDAFRSIFCKRKYLVFYDTEFYNAEFLESPVMYVVSTFSFNLTFQNSPPSCKAELILTVKRLYSLDIIIGKLDIREITFVPGVHYGFPYVRMFQTHAVSKLVNRHPVQVDAVTRSGCKCFVVVEVRVTRQT